MIKFIQAHGGVICEVMLKNSLMSTGLFYFPMCEAFCKLFLFVEYFMNELSSLARELFYFYRSSIETEWN